MNRFQINGRFPFYYWLFAGILIGILIGWMFSGFINMLFRLLLFAGVVIVIGLAIYLWGKISRTNGPPARQNDIPDGNWRTIDPSGRK
jgi:hypothetical protein